jgi:hypothetical protein
MFDVYDAGDKLLASHALLRDAIAILIDNYRPGDNSYIAERETNITLAIDNDANKLRFMLGAKGN